MEVLLVAALIIMVGGAVPLFYGYKFMKPRGSEENRLEHRGRPIVWDAAAG